MVLVVICAGLTGGTEAGAWVGFWAGLLYDMFLTTPVGLSALTYCLVGAGVGALRSSVLQERRALLPLAALVGTAASVLVFVGAGDVLGQTQLLGAGRAWLIRVMIVESLWGAALALPVGYIYAWVARGSAGADRVGSPVGQPDARLTERPRPDHHDPVTTPSPALPPAPPHHPPGGGRLPFLRPGRPPLVPSGHQRPPGPGGGRRQRHPRHLHPSPPRPDPRQLGPSPGRQREPAGDRGEPPDRGPEPPDGLPPGRPSSG